MNMRIVPSFIAICATAVAACSSPASDAGETDALPARNGDAEQVQTGSQYERCVGHNDGSRGSCSADEICGSMPYVGYEYCMPALPCAAGMVSVIDLACAYPCDDAGACTEHGLSRCAENTLAPFGGPPGWCTP